MPGAGVHFVCHLPPSCLASTTLTYSTHQAVFTNLLIIETLVPTQMIVFQVWYGSSMMSRVFLSFLLKIDLGLIPKSSQVL